MKAPQTLRCTDCEHEFPEKPSVTNITFGEVDPNTGTFKNEKPVPANLCPECQSSKVEPLNK